MRIRSALVFLLGGLLGAAAGFAAGIFVYPFVFLSDIVGTDRVDTRVAGRIVATGNFVHANPSDPIHYGKGRVTGYRSMIHLESDFEVGPGPKYHVYLVPEKNVTPATRVDKTMYVDLGRLRAFRGSQNYAIPEGVDVAAYGTVVIWCEHFNVLISPAELTPAK